MSKIFCEKKLNIAFQFLLYFSVIRLEEEHDFDKIVGISK